MFHTAVAAPSAYGISPKGGDTVKLRLCVGKNESVNDEKVHKVLKVQKVLKVS